MSPRLFGLLALALSLLSGPASAYNLVKVKKQNLRDSMGVRSATLRPDAALSAFSLGYNSGSDYKLNGIAVRADRGIARFELSDRSTSKYQRRYDAEARWAQHPTQRGQTATVRKRCRVRCSLPLPRTQGRWVLSGFSFKRPGKKKDHLLQIAVQMDRSQRNVEVVFRDGGRDVDFDVRVDVVAVPKQLLGRTERVQGRNPGNGRSVKLGRYRRGEIPLLAGFDVRFTNSDHKVRALIIEPCGRQAARCVRFWDRKPDDPFEAKLQLVWVKQSPSARGSTSRRRRRR